MAHVSRAAIYAPVWANLFRLLGHQEALKLTNHDIKLIQIALLFHDAAREGDEEDEWDLDSAELLFYYLKASGIEPHIALKIAEATANKDSQNAKCYYAAHITRGEITWKKINSQLFNIYQIIIHESDCLDIIRARDHFDATYLYFYKQYNKTKCGKDYLAQFIVEARSIIRKHGDTRGALQYEIKKYFEQEDGYEKSLATIQDENYHIIPVLYNEGLLLSQDKLKTAIHLPDLKDDNMDVLMRTGKIFARGIIDTPSALYIKPQTIGEEKIERTLVEVELYKAARRLGIPTSSSKENRYEKQGNPGRSVCILFPGAAVCAQTGFLIANPDNKKISSINIVDSDSGWEKKEELTQYKYRLFGVPASLKKMMNQLKMGGSSRSDFSCNFPANYTEITYDIEKFDAIYFTKDPCWGNEQTTGDPEPRHPFIPVIMALYLQQEYQQKHNEKLSIYEYSGIHGYIKKINDDSLSEDEIVKMWAAICSEYAASRLKSESFIDVAKIVKISIDTLKHEAILGKRDTHLDFVKTLLLPDKFYSVQLKERINDAITKAIYVLFFEQDEKKTQVILAARGDIQAYLYLHPDGITTLPDQCYFIAAVNGCNEFLDYFLELRGGSAIEFRDTLDNSLLDYAVGWGQLEIVKVLIKHHANIDKPDNNGFTPLHVAAHNGHIGVIEYLLQQGADPNAVSRYGRSILHIALDSDEFTPM